MKKNIRTASNQPKDNREITKIELDDVLQWKAASLVDLSKRLFYCARALCERDDILDELTMLGILHEYTHPDAETWRERLSAAYDEISLPGYILVAKTEDELECVFQHMNTTIKKSTSSYQDKHVLLDLALACKTLSENYTNGLMRTNLIPFVAYEQLLRSTSCEAIGYWTAKLSKMKQNYENTKTKTKLSEDQAAAIGEKLENFNIDDLQVFRTNKKLRHEFLEACRNVTKEIDEKHRKDCGYPLSDDCIMKKAREIIKTQRLNAASPAKTTKRQQKRR